MSIELSRHGSVLETRIRKGRANAIDIELLLALQEALANAAEEDSVGAVVLIGSGSIFSAGVDLFRVLDEGQDYFNRLWGVIDESLVALLDFPKPLVSAVNGHAIAGGCVLAQGADYRLMSRGSGQIGVPELIAGVPFPKMPLEIMRSTLPPGQFLSALYRGTRFDPEQALEAGLVDELTSQGDLLETACRRAEELARIPPNAFLVTKREVRLPILTAFRQRDDSLVLQALQSPEVIGRVEEYVARLRKK